MNIISTKQIQPQEDGSKNLFSLEHLVELAEEEKEAHFFAWLKVDQGYLSGKRSVLTDIKKKHTKYLDNINICRKIVLEFKLEYLEGNIRYLCKAAESAICTKEKSYLKTRSSDINKYRIHKEKEITSMREEVLSSLKKLLRQAKDKGDTKAMIKIGDYCHYFAEGEVYNEWGVAAWHPVIELGGKVSKEWLREYSHSWRALADLLLDDESCKLTARELLETIYLENWRSRKEDNILCDGIKKYVSILIKDPSFKADNKAYLNRLKEISLLRKAKIGDANAQYEIGKRFFEIMDDFQQHLVPIKAPVFRTQVKDYLAEKYLNYFIQAKYWFEKLQLKNHRVSKKYIEKLNSNAELYQSTIKYLCNHHDCCEEYLVKYYIGIPMELIHELFMSKQIVKLETPIIKNYSYIGKIFTDIKNSVLELINRNTSREELLGEINNIHKEAC